MADPFSQSHPFSQSLDEKSAHSQIKEIEPALLLVAIRRKPNIKWLAPFAISITYRAGRGIGGSGRFGGDLTGFNSLLIFGQLPTDG